MVQAVSAADGVLLGKRSTPGLAVGTPGPHTWTAHRTAGTAVLTHPTFFRTAPALPTAGEAGHVRDSPADSLLECTVSPAEQGTPVTC